MRLKVGNRRNYFKVPLIAGAEAFDRITQSTPADKVCPLVDVFFVLCFSEQKKDFLSMLVYKKRFKVHSWPWRLRDSIKSSRTATSGPCVEIVLPTAVTKVIDFSHIPTH